MNEEQKADIRYLIAHYDRIGADWSIALEYEVRRFNGNLPHQERSNAARVTKHSTGREAKTVANTGAATRERHSRA